MTESIRPLGDLKPQKGGGDRLYLRLPSREDPRLRKVRLALSFFPGEEQAVCYFSDTKKRLSTPCVIHPALTGELEELLGKENVVVR